MEEQRTDLMTVHEVAQGFRVDDTTVRRWIKCGVFQAIPLPHRGRRQAYRVLRTEFERVLGASSFPQAQA